MATKHISISYPDGFPLDPTYQTLVIDPTGFVGGTVSATAVGAAIWWATPFGPGQAALMAFVSTIMGFAGGLIMSAIKRDRGVKDWGRMIEGHGGMLDRLDSVIFAAPVFFHFVRFWWTP